MLRNFLIGGFVALSFALAPGQAINASGTDASSSNRDWTLYTSFDCSLQKIVSGNRYTYFLVHQDTYLDAQSENGTRAVNNGSVLRYDSQNPDKGIHCLANELPQYPSGSEARAIAYNPNAGYLLILYANNAIDLVYDDGRMTSITDLRDSTAPFSTRNYTISFPHNGNDAWIGTVSGYVHVNADKGYADARFIDSAITAVCPVGSKLMMIAGNNLYESDADKPADTLAEMTEVNAGIDKPEFIMPLSDNSFATISNSNSIVEVTRDNAGAYTARTLGSDSGIGAQLSLEEFSWSDPQPTRVSRRNYVVYDKENNVSATKEGYLVFSKTNAYHILKDVPGAAANIVTRKFSENSPTYVGTWDFKNFWMYEPRAGFHLEQAQGENGAIPSDGKRIGHEGPLGLTNAHMVYSPEYGMLVMNQTDIKYKGGPGFSYCGIDPILLSSFKNGKWTNLSPAYNLPEKIRTNPIWLQDVKTKLKNNVWSFTGDISYPLNRPLGFLIDPLYPSHVFTGSPWRGMAIFDFANLDAMPMRLIHNKNDEGTFNFEFNDYKKALFGTGSLWTFPGINPIGTDCDNNIWVYGMDHSGKTGAESQVILYCITPEARKSAMESNDVNRLGSLIRLDYKLDLDYTHPWWNSPGVSLTHSRNKGLIVTGYNGDSDWAPVVICDNKGTYADPSDDEAHTITHISSADGGTYDFYNTWHNAMIEDPVTGNVLIGTWQGAFEIDPRSPVVNNTIAGKRLSLDISDTGITTGISSDGILGFGFDEYNRLWVATEKGGVIGYNADRTEVIAHYNTSNSPIPSDCVYDVCWNPETKELMISTMSGIASVRVDAPLSSEQTAEAPFVSPAAVTPEFAGVVTVNNVSGSSMLTVTDMNGKPVRILGASDKGRVVWDLRDSDGSPVKGGTYRITDSTGKMDGLKVFVTR